MQAVRSNEGERMATGSQRVATLDTAEPKAL